MARTIRQLIAAQNRTDTPADIAARVKRIDNGNTFVFCDYVRERMGCVRGAGHNGPHALSLPPYPHGPVILSDD